MKGYKGFNQDLTCRDFQYEIGKTYEMSGLIGLCSRGFHFCETLTDCFDYYDKHSSRFCEIETGELVVRGSDKCCTDKITIVRELSRIEINRTIYGFVFSGWSTIPRTMPANDVTITGSFTKGAYKLTYKIDGVVYKIINYNFGATITPEASPTKEGYTFVGWSNIPSTMPAYDVIVTGSFNINKYKLFYIVDGVIYKTYELDYGATITPEPAPTKADCTFFGWSDIPSTMPNHNVTITGYFRNNVESVNTVIAEINGIHYILIGKARAAEVTKSLNYYKGDVTIPETVNYEGFTYQVTQIGENAFQNCYNLSSISIPGSVTKIGNSAFSYCSNLSSIVLPNSVQDIGTYAFESCKKLSSFTIPDGVTIIQLGTFSGCSGLKSIKIPNAVSSIDSYAFYCCSALESILLPPNLTCIGKILGCCFYKCESLSSIIIPDNVTEIYSNTFYGCTKLKTVTIGKSVTRIYNKAFAECKELESVVSMAENPPSTNSDAFENSYIEHVTLYVPETSVNTYKSQEPWCRFGKILSVSEEATGIGSIHINKQDTVIYSIDGRRLDVPQKGLNIIKTGQGRIRKVMIK